MTHECERLMTNKGAFPPLINKNLHLIFLSFSRKILKTAYHYKEKKTTNKQTTKKGEIL